MGCESSWARRWLKVKPSSLGQQSGRPKDRDLIIITGISTISLHFQAKIAFTEMSQGQVGIGKRDSAVKRRENRVNKAKIWHLVLTPQNATFSRKIYTSLREDKQRARNSCKLSVYHRRSAASWKTRPLFRKSEKRPQYRPVHLYPLNAQQRNTLILKIKFQIHCNCERMHFPFLEVYFGHEYPK